MFCCPHFFHMVCFLVWCVYVCVRFFHVLLSFLRWGLSSENWLIWVRFPSRVRGLCVYPLCFYMRGFYLGGDLWGNLGGVFVSKSQ